MANDFSFKVEFQRTLAGRFLNWYTFFSKEAQRGLQEVAEEIKKNAESSTPIDTGKASQSWYLTPMKKVKNQWEINVANRAKSKKGYPYPRVLEFGSTPGQRPWPNVGPRTVLAQSPESGETRIYSSQAPGGIIFQAKKKEVIPKNKMDILNYFRFLVKR